MELWITFERRVASVVFFLASFAIAAVRSLSLHIVVQRNFLSIDFEALGASDRKEVKGMEFVCRRCNHITKRNPYRVTTEDAGVVLLNMVVCSSCARLAKRLGLPAVKMKSALRQNVTRR
jgi:hypothetical protein